MPESSSCNSVAGDADVPLVLDRELIQMFCIDVCDGNMEIISELIEIYLRSVDGLVNDLRVALQTNDNNLLRHAAHTLKSSSLIFGAEQFSASLGVLEDMAHDGEVSGAHPIVDSIVIQAQQMHHLLPAELQRLSDSQRVMNNLTALQ